MSEKKIIILFYYFKYITKDSAQINNNVSIILS